MSDCCKTMTLAKKKTFVQVNMEGRPVINMVPDYGGTNIFFSVFKFCPWCGTSVK